MKVWLTSLGLASLAILVGIGLLGLRILPSAADSATNGRRLRMFVTGYTSCDASIRAVKACDGITASGRKAAPGTVACGPNYPFGTVFEIVGVGRMTCWDRGGAITDHNLDVWFPDVQSAIRAGISAKWMDVIVYSTAPVQAPAQQAAAPANAAPSRAGYGALAAPPTPTPVAAPPPTAQARVAAVAPPPPPPPTAAPAQRAAAPPANAPKAQPPANAAQPPAPPPAPAVEVAQPPAAAPAPAPAVAPPAVQVAEGGPRPKQPVARLDRAAPHATASESALGDLVADMLRTQYGARVGLVANRDLQGGLPSGVVAVEQVMEALTPGRHPLTQDLRGETLRAAVEHALSRLDGWEGFLHVSGLRVGYNPNAPVGQRLTRFEFSNGEPVADQAWYRVALTDGVYFGPGYTSILQAGKGLFAYQPLDEMAINWLRQRGSVAPGLDGRLAIVH